MVCGKYFKDLAPVEVNVKPDKVSVAHAYIEHKAASVAKSKRRHAVLEHREPLEPLADIRKVGPGPRIHQL